MSAVPSPLTGRAAGLAPIDLTNLILSRLSLSTKHSRKREAPNVSNIFRGTLVSGNFPT